LLKLIAHENIDYGWLATKLNDDARYQNDPFHSRTGPLTHSGDKRKYRVGTITQAGVYQHPWNQHSRYESLNRQCINKIRPQITVTADVTGSVIRNSDKIFPCPGFTKTPVLVKGKPLTFTKNHFINPHQVATFKNFDFHQSNTELFYVVTKP
jgi:hypothetical protein